MLETPDRTSKTVRIAPLETVRPARVVPLIVQQPPSPRYDTVRTLRRALTQGWRAAQSLELDAAAGIAHRVEQGSGLISGADAADLRSGARILHATVFALSDDYEAAVQWARRALSSPLPEPLLALAHDIVRYGIAQAGDETAESCAPDDPGTCALQSASRAGKALELCFEAATALRQLRITQAKWIGNEALQLAGSGSGSSRLPALFSRCILAQIAYEDGDWARVAALIDVIRQSAPQTLPVECLVHLYPVLASAAQHQGNPGLAEHHLVEGERMASDRDSVRLAATCLRERIRLLARCGRIAKATQCLRRLEALAAARSAPGKQPIRTMHLHLTLAESRLMIEGESRPEDVGVMRGAYGAARRRGDAYGAVRIAVRLVDRLYRKGDAEDAGGLLVELLATAASAGLFQSFIDAGTGVHALLKSLSIRAGTLGGGVGLFVRVITRRIDALKTSPTGEIVHGTCRLTSRERTVLHLIGQGRSNKEIARQLNVAPETVKSFAKHIFLKLGTQSRAQSVAVAAKLGLL